LSRAPRLAALATATPPHRTRQSDAKSLAAEMFQETLEVRPALLQVFDHTGIACRQTCMPLEWYGSDHGFAERNALYLEHALKLSTEVAQRSLDRAGLRPRDIDQLVFVSSTGLATPSVDAHLANALSFRADVRRTPIWGLGCAGGAAGLSRARDFALADPGSRVLLIALELCTLTFQRNDLTQRNLIAASLFGDGAAAAVVLGADVPRNGGEDASMALLASGSTLWKDSLDVMGWTVDGDGLHVVFSKDIPSIVRQNLRPSLSAFLASQRLELDGLEHLVVHPGGVKVLAAYAEALGRPPEAFEHSRDVLHDHGNMSSPTCLFVLERFLRSGTIAEGERAVVAALGPGFSSEFVLLQRAME
jgi:alkylresorcinol/alkylpyrone synthase